MDEFIANYSHFIYHFGNSIYFVILAGLAIGIGYLFKGRSNYRILLISISGFVLALLTAAVLLINFPLRPIIESASRVEDILHQPMHDFPYDNLRSGKKERISDLKGRVLIINFWATYCSPCVKELPMFAKLEKDYGNKVYILAISDEPVEKIQRFMDKHVMPERVGKFSEKPWIDLEDFRPLTIVVDKSGHVDSFTVGEKDYSFFERAIVRLLTD